MQHPEQFGRQRNAGKNDTRDIATRPIEACDQASSNWIGADDEYDRRCCGCSLAGPRRNGAGAYDRGYLFADEIGR